MITIVTTKPNLGTFSKVKKQKFILLVLEHFFEKRGGIGKTFGFWTFEKFRSDTNFTKLETCSVGLLL